MCTQRLKKYMIRPVEEAEDSSKDENENREYILSTKESLMKITGMKNKEALKNMKQRPGSGAAV